MDVILHPSDTNTTNQTRNKTMIEITLIRNNTVVSVARVSDNESAHTIINDAVAQGCTYRVVCNF